MSEKAKSIDFNAIFAGLPSEAALLLTQLNNIATRDNSAQVAEAKAALEKAREAVKSAREALKTAKAKNGLTDADVETVKSARQHSSPIIAGIASKIRLPRGVR